MGLRGLALVGVAGVLAAPGGAPQRHRPPAAHAGRRPAGLTRTAVRSPGSRAAASVVGRLSLAQLAGQRILYAYSGPAPPRTLLARIRAGEAAGVVFFAPNVTSAAALRAVIAELQHANASSPVRSPLLMVVDQEGGLVRRLPGAPTLSEKEIGAMPGASALAAQAGGGAGRNLRAAGVTVNLAPVLDVFRSPGDFIDRFQRSYGSSAPLVAQLGAAFITAQQRTGVAATAKHFPGLGAAAANENTDSAPVRLAQSSQVVRSIDEAPYRAAIAAGAKLVMASWATYPALDPRLPAGLSPAVIHGELRMRLGFRGVTIPTASGPAR